MSFSFRPAPILACAAMALPVAAAEPAPAPVYGAAIEEAVFDICPELRAGRIAAADLRWFEGRGYRRDPEAEDMRADIEDGAPVVFATGAAPDIVSIEYWQRFGVCDVRFSGPQAADALAPIRARIGREWTRFARDAAADHGNSHYAAEVWRTLGQASVSLVILSPGPASSSQLYIVSLGSAN